MTRLIDERTRFWWCDNSVIDDNGIAKLGASAYCIYTVLLRHADRNGEAFPSLSLLQERTGFARGTVVTALKKLITIGMIRKVKPGDRAHNSTVYGVAPVNDQLKLVQPLNQLATSSTIELVQPLNRTSSTIEPELVQPLNPKNTNKKTNEENQSFLNAQPKAKTKKSAFSDPNQEQPQVKVEPRATLSGQGSDRELTGEDQFSAAPTQSRNDFALHPTAQTDKRFEKPPWGWEPSAGFIQFVRARLSSCDPYKARNQPPTDREVKAWLSRASRDIDRAERADAAWGDYQDTQAKAAESAAPPISFEDFTARYTYLSKFDPEMAATLAAEHPQYLSKAS